MLGKFHFIKSFLLLSNKDIDSKSFPNRSCRKKGSKWIVAMNRWQELTDMEVNEGKSSVLDLFFARCLTYISSL